MIWRLGVFAWLWGPVVGWAYGIFYLSHIPGLTVAFGLWDFILRKIGHFTEYFIFAALIFRALRRTFFWELGGLLLAAVFLSCLYAVADEVHQLFVFQRHGSPWDVMIDAVGACSFVLLARRYQRTSA